MKSKKILGNFILSIINTVLSLIFPLITFPYVSRILGSTNLGIVNFAQSYGYYFIHFANFGISSYAIREISRVRDDEELLNKKANEIFNINCFFSILSWLLYIAISLCIPKFRENFGILFVYSFMILTNFLSIEWLLQSFDDYFFSTFRNSMVRIVALVSVFLLVRSKEDFVLYMAISTFSEMGARLATLNYSNKKYVLLKIKKRYLNFKDHFSSLFTLFTFRLVNGISAQLDKLMLGFMMVYSSVGVYSAGVKMVLMLAPIVETVGIVMFPTINIALEESKESYYRLVKFNYNMILAMGIPMTVGLFLVAPMIVKVFAGDGYLEAISVLRIMSIIVTIGPIGDLLGSKTLLIHGKNKELLICSSIVAISNILLNLLFIPFLGINGAALASVLSYFVANFSRYYFTNKIMSFSLFSKELFKYCLFTLPFFIVKMMFSNAIDNSFLSCFIFILFSILCYIFELVVTRDKTFFFVLDKVLKKDRSYE